MPSIAIIIPNYNDSRFLINIIRKFAAQEPDELIVVDDGSTDYSLEVLEALQKKYKFEILKNQNKGAFSAFVTGCRHAKS